MTQTFKTPKGTELPLMDIKGKPYLQVAHRLVWFREEHPDWAIETEIVEQDATHAIVRAFIRRPERGELVATGTKSETKAGFPDFLEKAETGAVGRALALCGFGTQFAPELDEGQRLADAPSKRSKFAVPTASDPNAGKTADQIAPPAIPPKTRDFSATKDQLTELADLVKEKLGATTKDEILPALNKELGTSFKSATEITRATATALIGSLKNFKQSTPIPAQDGQDVETIEVPD